MNLKEFIEEVEKDRNLFWRLQSGEHQNLLYEAIEKIDDLSNRLEKFELMEDYAKHISQPLEAEVKPATCGNCKYYCSYREEYEDDLEPDDCGFCEHPNKILEHVIIEHTCEMHEPSKLSV